MKKTGQTNIRQILYVSERSNVLWERYSEFHLLITNRWLIADSSVKISVHWADEVRKVNTHVENKIITILKGYLKGKIHFICGFSSGEHLGKSKAEEKDWWGN